jgi:hypothetical protein
MHFPRIRVRTLAVLVLFSGLGLWGSVMWMRSAEYHRLAAVYAELEASEREELQRVVEYFTLLQRQIDEMGIASPIDYEMEVVKREASARQEIESDQRNRLKYERAARYPWLPLPHDAGR